MALLGSKNVEGKSAARTSEGQLFVRGLSSRLLGQKKLTLLVDLDQTLIHTTGNYVDENLKSIHHFSLPGYRGELLHTHIRPGTAEFLENISELFEMHVVTFGTRPYADRIVSILDPSGKYFGRRVLSREESVSQRYKTPNLEWISPLGEEMVCMIDDRADVWQYAPNLVKVKPYIYFRGTGDINAPPGVFDGSLAEEEIEDLDDDDGYLFYLEGSLREIHRSFYEAYDNSLELELEGSIPVMLPDLRQIVPRVLTRPLRRAVIAFSGYIPKNFSVRNSVISEMAISLGAEVREDVCEGVTHLVAARADTSKVRKARKLHKVKVVSLEWLRSCHEGWLWEEETPFHLDDTPEMIAKRIAKQEAKLSKTARKLRFKVKRANSLESQPDTSSGEAWDLRDIKRARVEQL